MSDYPSVLVPPAAPAVSVILPVYNSERYLREAVESVLAQTFRDFELVIVNDGSTDRSGEILRELADRDSRIRLFAQQNGGVVAALNRAAEQARGELLARMDADDISLPTRLQRQVDYLRDHPDCVALGTRILAIDPDGVPVAEQFLLTRHEDIDAAHMAGGCSMAHPTVIMRRSALDRFPPYRGRFAEDIDLWLRLAERGRVANLSDALLKYRLHMGSVSYSSADVKREAFEPVLSEADCRRGVTGPRPPLPDDVGKPVPPHVAPWLWCRLALTAGNYRSAWTLARKAVTRSKFTRSGAITLILVALGPIGRAVLTWHYRTRRVS